MTLTVVVMIALMAASALAGLGQGLGHRALGLTYGPRLTGEVATSFAHDYAQEALLGLISLLILGAFAGLAALYTRSILGGLLASLGFSTLDPMSLAFLLLLGNWFDKPELINLYQFTPSYNVDNARSWFIHQSALAIEFAPSFTAAPSLAVSLAVLATWVVGLVALAAFIFQRQDITS